MQACAASQPIQRSSLGVQKPITQSRSMFIQEVLVTQALFRSNASMCFGIYIFSVIPRLLLIPLSLSQVSWMVLVTCLMAFGFQYSFDIVNQTYGVTEDSLNKPYRPLPSRMVTTRGAKARWLLSWICYPLLAYRLSGSLSSFYAVVWLVNIEFFYVWPRPNHFFWRNVFCALATLAATGQTNAIVVAEHPELNLQIVLRGVIIGWAFLVVHLQEFHDAPGDKAAGKRTLPVVLGERQVLIVRRVTCGIFCTFHASLMLLAIYNSSQITNPSWLLLLGVLQLILGFTLGLKVLQSDSMKKDRSNYFIWLVILMNLLLIFITTLGRVI